MSDKDKNKWKRKVPTRIYDYNYKVGESYYNPQTDFISDRELLRQRKAPPPEAQTYAERFASRPFYGTARGLPYDDSQAEISKPIQRRAHSASRARSSRDRELDDEPTTSRTGRSRDRKLSFNLDDFDADVKKSFKDFSLDCDNDIKPKSKSKFSLIDDSDFKIPVRRFSIDVNRDARDTGDEFQIRAENKSELMKKFKDIEKEFEKANALERRTPSRSNQYEQTAWNDELNIPGRKSVRRDEVSYTDPSSGSKVHKSSYSEASKFESSSSSSKPPRPPRVSRLLSSDNDSEFKLPSMPRHRRISMSELSDADSDIRSFTPKTLSQLHREDEFKFRGAREIRDQRKARESDELTQSINRMINKMKTREDRGDEVRISRTFRSSSLDPYQRETVVKATPTTRQHRFVYGVSRI